MKKNISLYAIASHSYTSGRWDYTQQGWRLLWVCARVCTDLGLYFSHISLCRLNATLQVHFFCKAKQDSFCFCFLNFLLKTKSFSGIWQLVDSWVDFFLEKTLFSSQHSIIIHCISSGHWQGTTHPALAPAAQVRGFHPLTTLTQNQNTLGWWPWSIRLPSEGSVLDGCTQRTVVPLFSF